MSLDLLKSYLNSRNFDISERQIRQFETFASLLSLRNKQMNLTAVDEGRDTEIRHFIDSLSVLNEADNNSDISCSLHNVKIIDIGTGAGFPGIPLAIMLPDSQFTLVDSLQKRISFLNEVVSSLSLENVTPVAGRFEELGRLPEFREQFDVGVSRAVADLRVLSEYSLPFIKEGGFFAAFKSGSAEEEIENASNALDRLSGTVEYVSFYHEYSSDVSRSIVFIRKEGSTSEKYPRRNGIPSKRPL